MGLDMYLNAERYVSGYDHSPKHSRQRYGSIRAAAELTEYSPPDHDDKYVEVSTCVMYWRKANAIHAWFLNKRGPRTGDGQVIDDCRPIDVDIDDLRELLSTARGAIAAYQAGDFDKCMELLQPVPGFFFGSTDIDDWYLRDLQDTVAGLEHIIKAYDAEEALTKTTPEHRGLWLPSFTYRASW